jgi:hypothetical protein
VTTQRLCRGAASRRHRYRTLVTCLGPPAILGTNVDHVPVEVDVVPGQVREFAKSHAGVGEDRARRSSRRLARRQDLLHFRRRPTWLRVWFRLVDLQITEWVLGNQPATDREVDKLPDDHGLGVDRLGGRPDATKSTSSLATAPTSTTSGGRPMFPSRSCEANTWVSSGSIPNSCAIGSWERFRPRKSRPRTLTRSG